MKKNKEIKQITAKRKKQTRYLSQAIQLEEAVNPHIVRATMTMVSLALLVFIAWAGLTNINEVARTPGEIIPHGHQQTVQHLEGGIVKVIHAHEGDIVETGQTLLTLDDASLKEDLERLQAKQLDLALQEERLRAFTENRDPDFSLFASASPKMIADQWSFFTSMRIARDKEKEVIRNQITEKKQNITALHDDLKTARSSANIAQNMYDKRLQLNKKGYASDMALLEDEKTLNEAQGDIRSLNNDLLRAKTEITEYEERLSSLSARHRDETLERLAILSAEKAQHFEIIEKMEERMNRLAIRSPVRGLVKGFDINTIGSIIQPGQTIMEIVPIDKNLEVAIKISPQDIGHLKIGQPVQVKFSTFDFSRYGSVAGVLDYISATTFSSDKGDRYYQGRVLLNQNHVGKSTHNVILPGMTVMADIITGDKTILQYMLKPIHISLRTAFTER